MFFYQLLRQGTGSPLEIYNVLIAALAFLLVIVFSVVIHEISHGYVAYWNGDPTAKMRGRLTLNPVAHFDLWGILMFLICGFGFAKPVPVDARNFKNYKKGMISVSVAGVTANLCLAGIGLLLLYLLRPVFNGSTNSALGLILLYLLLYLLVYGVTVNMMLAFFNLLPIYPLDGFNLLNTFLPHNSRYQQFMIRYGFFILIGLILIGRLGDMFGFPYLNIFGLYSDLIQRLISAVLGA